MLELEKVKPQVLARHFPVLLNMLLDVMVTKSEQTSRAAFIAFIDVIDAYALISLFFFFFFFASSNPRQREFLESDGSQVELA